MRCWKLPAALAFISLQMIWHLEATKGSGFCWHGHATRASWYTAPSPSCFWFEGCAARPRNEKWGTATNVAGLVPLTFLFGLEHFKWHCWRFSIMRFPCRDPVGKYSLCPHENAPPWPQRSDLFPIPSGKVEMISLVSWKCRGPALPIHARLSLPPWGGTWLLSHNALV